MEACSRSSSSLQQGGCAQIPDCIQAMSPSVLFWFALVAEPNHAEDTAYDEGKHWQLLHAVVLTHYKQLVVASCIPSWLQHTTIARILTMSI